MLRREIEKLAPMNDKEKIEAYRKRYAFFRFRMFSTIKTLVKQCSETGTMSIDKDLMDEVEKYRTEEMTIL